jgi:hypothetical protein
VLKTNNIKPRKDGRYTAGLIGGSGIGIIIGPALFHNSDHSDYGWAILLGSLLWVAGLIYYARTTIRSNQDMSKANLDKLLKRGHENGR